MHAVTINSQKTVCVAAFNAAFVGAGINWNSQETESEENEIFIASIKTTQYHKFTFSYVVTILENKHWGFIIKLFEIIIFSIKHVYIQ